MASKSSTVISSLASSMFWTRVSIDSDSEHFVRLENQSVFVLYDDPIEFDEIECRMLYLGDQEVGFSPTIRVLPSNNPPRLVKEIPDFVVRPGKDVEIDLREFFMDDEGDQLLFQPSSPWSRSMTAGPLPSSIRTANTVT